MEVALAVGYNCLKIKLYQHLKLLVEKIHHKLKRMCLYFVHHSHVVITALCQDPVKINVIFVLKPIKRKVISDSILFMEVQGDGIHIHCPSLAKASGVGVRSRFCKVRGKVFDPSQGWADQEADCRNDCDDPHPEGRTETEMI